MLKKLMLGVALGALTLSGALAQTPAPSTTPAPAAQSSAPKTTAPAMNESKPATAAQTTDGAKVVNAQTPDQWLASSFKGTDVIGTDDKKIGDISDILFDKTGKIEAFVVSVGGFLGVGSKEVALAPTAFEVVPGDKAKHESDKLRLAMSKDELKAAQDFARYQPPRPATTTGSGLGSKSPAGMGGGMRPSTNTPPSGTSK